MHLQVLAAIIGMRTNIQQTPLREDTSQTPSLFFVDSRSILHEGLRMTCTNIPILISFFVQDAPRVHKEEMVSTSQSCALSKRLWSSRDYVLNRVCDVSSRRGVCWMYVGEANIDSHHPPSVSRCWAAGFPNSSRPGGKWMEIRIYQLIERKYH
jgi:hypothetical protein